MMPNLRGSWGVNNCIVRQFGQNRSGQIGCISQTFKARQLRSQRLPSAGKRGVPGRRIDTHTGRDLDQRRMKSG
ncbi:unnamed protein product [Protopolystoma xenopodis]|uniref:Uncharacterized protein n=1 Tax=Protopolystoma xenopodis TaxID=117903 RepID=A0A3S4ZYT0_9PLAT|nr:unnamed protein product [Protopolystoma xenopodis]